MTDYPKKFVGLHAHSTFSIGDAIGRPKDHIDFAIKNDMDAIALTDHGNMNGFSHQYTHGEYLKKQGIKFKPLYGVEAYFVPSLSNWRKLYDENREQLKQEKIEKKKQEAKEKIDKLIADIAGPTKEDLIVGQAESELDKETQGDSGIEDEDASKRGKWKNPLFQRNHLVLLPKNSEGLKDLFACVSHSFIDGFYRFPRMDFELLEKYAKGNIIASTACIAGLPSKIIFDNQIETDWEKYAPNDDNKEIIQDQLAEMVSKFHQALGPENFYLELQFNKLGAQHLANYHIIECSKRTGVKLVVTADSHYSDPTHWREREIYRCMARMQFMKAEDVNLPKTIDELKCELYPKNAEQIWKSYLDTTNDYDFYDNTLVKEAIERTHEIAHEQIDDPKPDCSTKFPKLNKIIEKKRLEKILSQINSVDEDDVAFEALKQQVIVGAKWRGIHEDEAYIQRLKTELEVVKHLKFSKYFLTYSRIMKIVDRECFRGPGRGSGAGSLMCYVLDITQIDPIKNGLLFERFLTKHKKGMPDIDSDVSDRDKALKLLNEYFGDENVVAVSNFNQLQMRSLIKDVCRLNGVSFKESNEATKKIEKETKTEARKEPGFDATQWFLTFDAAVRDSETFRGLLVKYPDFEKQIKILFKNNRNISRHAGGLIIADDAMENFPIIKSGGVLQTPWTEGLKFRHLESFGFLKYDILALGTLRMFENCIRRILKSQGIKYPSFDQIKSFYYEKLHPDNNDMNDKKVFKHVYWKQNYAGVFQFVRPQVQEMMAKMKPTCLKDIAIITSLYRPGPLAIGAEKVFLKNRKKPEAIVYKHPLLKEVLEDTSGLILFQEQLQLIYHKLAGVPLDQTDDVRKAFTKKDASNKEQAAKERKRLRDDFIEKCQKTNSISPKISASIFDEMEKYVKYSFNLSHAISYATISYQCAWFLTYYPDEWVATYIDYCIEDKGKVAGYEDPKAVALSEAQTLGYEISKPDINKSNRDFTVKEGKLIPSFSSIKSVGVTAQSEIFHHRPYKTLEDLLWNSNDTWRHSKFNKRALSSLVQMEALDSMDLVGPDKMFKNYRQLYHVVVENNELLKRAISRKKQTHKELLKDLIEQAQDLEDWSLEEKIKSSKELSGSVDINLIVTPKIRKFFAENSVECIDNWKKPGSVYWAIVEHSTIATTKQGKKYCRVKLYGDSGVTYMCFLWNYNELKDKNIPENSLIIGNFKKSSFGLAASFGKFSII